MSGYSWSVPSAAPSTTPAPERASQRDKLWGRDVWLDVTATGADTITTSAGDVALVEGREALRQWLIRMIITEPGEYAVLPGFGAGARGYVKARNSPAVRDELAQRIRAQALRSPRVERVSAIAVEVTEDAGGLQINLQVVPKGRVKPDETLAITIGVR